MRVAQAIVRGGRVGRTAGDPRPMPAASLVKPVVAHVALAVVDDLDEPVHGAITVRHVLSHTTGLPNREPGSPAGPLPPLRPPGVRWGYSGEGFVLLGTHLERRTGRPLDRLVAEHVLGPLAMADSSLGDPGPDGGRELHTTAADYGRFLAHVLARDDVRWRPQWPIDDELAWGAGWGLELGPPVHGWQWGFQDGANHFAIGCPATGDGVVVLTDSPDEGRAAYRTIVERELPGDHPSLRVEHNPVWLDLVAGG